MNLIKDLGNDKFEIDLAPETVEWLKEMAIANGGDGADITHALNGAIVQMYAGWKGFKRSVYEQELARVQADQAVTGDADAASEQSILMVALEPILTDAERMAAIKNAAEEKRKAAEIDSEFMKPTSAEDAFVNILFGVIADTVKPEQREKVKGIFVGMKDRLAAMAKSDNTTAPRPSSEISKEAINKAMGNQPTGCACGNPECNNGFTQADIEKQLTDFFGAPLEALKNLFESMPGKNDGRSK